MSVNKTILVGNVGKDGANLRYTANGTAVTSFSLATNERFKDRDGNAQEKVAWHKIVAWRQLAEICGKFLTPGKQVYIEGKIEYGSYINKDGVTIPTTEIVADQLQMLGPKGESTQTPDRAAQRQPASQGGGAEYDTPFNPDDDIPF